MVNIEKILDILDIHFKEFERVYKCLNKAKLPSEKTVEFHVKTLVYEYNFITKIFNSNIKKVDESLTFNIQETLIKFRNKIIKIFLHIDLQIVIPEVRNLIELKENIFGSNSDIDNNDDTIVNFDIDFSDKDEMAITVIEFINFATRTIPEFDGTPADLQRFIDAVNLVNANVGEFVGSAVEVVKSKLKGTARNFITNEADLKAITDKLTACIKSESSNLIISKLKSLKQQNKSPNDYVTDLEKLTASLKRAYITEGVPVDTAESYTTANVVQAIKLNTNNEKVKLIMEAGEFKTVAEASAKFLSVYSENNLTHAQINYFQQKRFKNFRGNQRFNRGNSNFYRGNNYQGNYSRNFNSFKQGNQSYRNNDGNTYL